MMASRMPNQPKKPCQALSVLLDEFTALWAAAFTWGGQPLEVDRSAV